MTDKEWMKHHISRLEEAGKRNNTSIDRLFPRGVGSIVKGTVFDVRRKSFERVLKDVDKDLFVIWNPYHNGGIGSWQVWITPLEKTLINQYNDGVIQYSTLEYRLLPVAHHIADLPCLNYEFITRIKKSRITFKEIEYQDYEARRKQVREEESARDDKRAAVREDRRYWKAFQEYVQSGYNPMWFFDHKRKII